MRPANTRNLPDIEFVIESEQGLQLLYDEVRDYLYENVLFPTEDRWHFQDYAIDDASKPATRYAVCRSTKNSLLNFAKSYVVELAQLNSKQVYARLITDAPEGLSKLREPLIDMFRWNVAVRLRQVSNDHRNALESVIQEVGLYDITI